MADRNMVDYTERIKPFFEGVAPVEATTTASSQHLTGQLFYLNGQLVVATSDIAVNDTIVKTEGSTVGNCEDANDIVTMLAGKQNTLTFDNIPTQNSNNPVRSGGVYNANQNIFAVMGENGARNILPLTLGNIKALSVDGTWNGNVYTHNGVDWTVTADEQGYVTKISASGTTGASASVLRLYKGNTETPFIGRNLILSGCPANGSSSTYRLQAYRVGSVDGSSGTFMDVGEGITFDYLNNGTGTIAQITANVMESQTVSGLEFYPMLRDSKDIDNIFQKYAKTNQELTKEVSSLNIALTPLTATLSQGATSVTISDARITTNSVVIPVSETFGLVPNSVTVTTGQVVMTYQAQAQAENVGVLVF